MSAYAHQSPTINIYTYGHHGPANNHLNFYYYPPLPSAQTTTNPYFMPNNFPFTCLDPRLAPEPGSSTEDEASLSPATPSPAPVKKRGRPPKIPCPILSTTVMKKPYAGRKKDQARQQHAEAEAGRRNRDFTAFKALAEVVPGLDGNRTKADQACYALSWLERMIADNEQMESELADHDVMDDFLTRSEESSVFSEFTVEE